MQDLVQFNGAPSTNSTLAIALLDLLLARLQVPLDVLYPPRLSLNHFRKTKQIHGFQQFAGSPASKCIVHNSFSGIDRKTAPIRLPQVWMGGSYSELGHLERSCHRRSSGL